MTDIKKAKILIIATNGFEQSELEVPRDKLKEAGAKVTIATQDGKDIMGWDKKDWGRPAKADMKIADAKEGDYDALVIPGGVMNPDKLRVDEDAMKLVKAFLSSGKIVAAVCHGPWLLVQADALKGRQATSYHFHPQGCGECRRQMDRRGSGGGQRHHHQPQARRPAGVRQKNHRRSGRGQALPPGGVAQPPDNCHSRASGNPDPFTNTGCPLPRA